MVPTAANSVVSCTHFLLKEPLVGWLSQCLAEADTVSCCIRVLGLRNKGPQTGWLKQEKFISYDFGGCKSKIRVPAWWDLVRACFLLFLACRPLPFHCVLTWLGVGSGVGSSLSSSSYKDTNPIMRTPLLQLHPNLITSPRPLPPLTRTTSRFHSWPPPPTPTASKVTF